MDSARISGQINWDQLNLAERIVMLAMTSGPQRNTDWPVQRALCFHKLTELSGDGLVLTHFGRQVMAERHGLPIAVGQDPHAPRFEEAAVDPFGR